MQATQNQTSKPTIRKRSKLEAALTNSTCSPSLIADRLPVVDVDPCSNPRSIIRAHWAFSLEKRLDGLKLPWRGTAFVNWPFSDPAPFAEKAVYEMACGNCIDLIVLCKDDSSTAWMKLITSWTPPPSLPRGHILSVSPEMWQPHDRVQYDEHPAVVEERRLTRIAKAMKGDAAKGIEPKTREWCDANIDGASTSNFCSVIIHRRGFFADGSRRPILHGLEDIATRWVQP